MSGKISIIVPVYNAEGTLEATVASLLGNTYEDFEIILVNDGSVDNSADICADLSVKNERILYIAKENGGPSSARNAGLDLATGEYIAFCDSDDLVEPFIYERLIGEIEKGSLDAAFCDIFSERNQARLGFPWNGDRCFSGNDEISYFIASMIGSASDDDTSSPVWGSVCRAVYKRKIIEDNKIRFKDDVSFAEDLIFTVEYLRHTSAVKVIDEALYFYTDNKASIMNSFYGYKRQMLSARLRLVGYLEGLTEDIKDTHGIKDRLKVTERCYYHECVGNAVRPSQDRTKADMLSEIRQILLDERVKNAFSSFKVGSVKKKCLYTAIKFKLARVLYLYYRVQFRKHS